MRFILLSFTFTFFLTSCSSILIGSKQSVYVNSNVEDAQILVDGKPKGFTSSKIRVKKKGSRRIEIIKDGYRPDYYMLTNSKVHWTAYLNFVSYYIGFAIDAGTGGCYRYLNNNITMEMIKYPKLQDEISIDFKGLDISIRDGDIIGKTYKKKKEKGVITYKNNSFFKNDVINEKIVTDLENNGFEMIQDSKYKIKPTLNKIEVIETKISNKKYNTKSEVEVKWVIYKNNEVVSKESISASSFWEGKGTTAVEKSILMTYYKFIANSKFE